MAHYRYSSLRYIVPHDGTHQTTIQRMLARDGEMMQPLFKVLLFTTVTTLVGLNACSAAEKIEQRSAKLATEFKSEEHKSGYALGLLMARSVVADLESQKWLGVVLQKEDVLVGIQDGFGDRAKFDELEMQQVLQALNQRINQQAATKRVQEMAQQAAQGEQFRQNFSRQPGVVQTKSGLIYLIERLGKGDSPKESDTVVVNYKGTLIDGTKFDSSYDRAEPTTFILKRVIPGWVEGLQQIKKAGKIKLVIPPKLAYGEQNVPGIPVNSTLIFEIELLDINPVTKQTEIEKVKETASAKKAAATVK